MLGDAVTFTGYVSEAQFRRRVRQRDVLAFPSLFEGFGIPAIEAMYAGVPVVASNTGSLPEVVGDAGISSHHATSMPGRPPSPIF